jgi:hypothetical protein
MIAMGHRWTMVKIGDVWCKPNIADLFQNEEQREPEFRNFAYLVNKSM